MNLPPQNLDAEKAAIGCVMVINEAMDEIDTKPDEFYLDAHRLMFQTITEMWQRGCRTIDSLTLAEELERRGTLEKAGGGAYVVEVTDSVPHAAHVRHYAGIVRDCWQRRQLIASCKVTMAEAYQQGDGREITESHLLQVNNILECHEDADVMTLAEAIERRKVVESTPEHLIATGLVNLDRKLGGGFGASHLVVIACRPSVGKSVLGAQLCLNASRDGSSTLIVSLEMEAQEIAGRFMGPKDYRRSDTLQKLQDLPLFMTETARSLSRIRSVIRKQTRKRKMRLVVIDYLQLMEPENKSSVREQQIAATTRSLKLLAGELKIPIVLLCQLNRACETEKRAPRLSDLRESGAIEQDADTVLLLDRPEMRDPEDQRDVMWIDIAKQRNGPRAQVPVTFLAAKTRVENASRQQEPPIVPEDWASRAFN